MQSQKDSRPSTACNECQRRKQKCSREWPCNHCQARKVAHLCQFSAKKTLQESTPESGRESSSETRGRKRSAPDPSEPSSLSFPHASVPAGGQDGLKIWGYMPGHVHYKIGYLELIGQRHDSTAETSPDTVAKVVGAIPPRSITDSIVNHFLTVVNYRYPIIYGPTLTDQYVQWWSDRSTDGIISPEFTCLLLRICAYTVQYLTPSMREMIEFELACSSQALTERLANAAEQISRDFLASNTSIERIQEGFLKSAWLKAESKIVESWHTLGSTIREAQELGIDKDAGIEGLSEFDIEIRRRVWAILYIWDWQMSAWLGRPSLIDQRSLNFTLPSLRLDQSTTESEVPSPFTHMVLQAELGRRVTAAVGGASANNLFTAKQVLDVKRACENFIEELPPIFRVKDPDLSLDEQHPYFVLQRHQLHCVVFITMLHVFKPYLTRQRRDRITDQDDEFRRMGVEIAHQLFQVSRDLLDHEFSINAKFQVVVFAIFDTATLLCSAIIHDRDHVLHRREEVIELIQSSLSMLHQLSFTTKLGATSYNFLAKLVEATPALSRQSLTAKRRKHTTNSLPPPTPPVKSAPALVKSESLPTVITSLSQGSPHKVAVTAPTTVETVASPTRTTTDDLTFDIDNFLAHHPFGQVGNPPTLDMGGMEQIWEWEDLRLDGCTQQGSNS
ncbi:hypothetical protein LEMA_P047420.1 [Plenodomus lingam JN3]|uniref:Zn(2)-C6 fungal-type domain-containing protein n=2 Tax=Leptosphaeria maculans TaxID=5022 RepID=E5R566_LEPMJ|nr:hypothetical protein LEMA_P047420.1 [Plenodomus lingam JN3]CBX92036.1 hypothetical protein LEMA_P047420.1 [Plenodomus lingam JN3]